MKTGEVIGILQNATARIERILKFTREYQDLGVNTPAWQDLGATLHTARAAIETGPVRFLPGEECPGLEIFADPLLPRVFSSLIENSLRHGGKVTEIRVRCVTGPSGLVILYEDNGTGIPAAIRPVLFEHGKGKNAGYGLFLAGEILGMTGLTLTETGEPGRGVRFEIAVLEHAFRTTGNNP
jgi:signal transduction histidine kinase